jgi:hypothetical protein
LPGAAGRVLWEIAAGNGRTVDETLGILDKTAASDRSDHPQEYDRSAEAAGARQPQPLPRRMLISCSPDPVIWAAERE